MIIEGLITCASRGDKQPHVAALGPVVNPELTQWTLRPFQSSTIFSRLRDNPRCVFHTLDDALPLVQLVLGHTPDLTFRAIDADSRPADECDAWVIEQACHWYELEIVSWDITGPRSEAVARLVRQGSLRTFWGWNRAKHALLEAAILISRKHLITADDLRQQLAALRSPIEKTAGPRELAAWALIEKARAAEA